jgi:hypothetical protein
MHPACVFHKMSKTLYILGGYKNGGWTGICQTLTLGSDTLVDIDPIPESLLGPVATIPNQESLLPEVYVSGVS